MGHGRDGGDAQQHHDGTVPGDGPDLRAEVAQRGGERGQVKERGDEQEEQCLRLELDAREAGDSGEGEAAEHQEHRVGQIEPTREDAQGGRDGQENDGELQPLHRSPR